MLNSLDHCYMRGFDAAKQGLSISTNPYKGKEWNRYQREAWLRGFNAFHHSTDDIAAKQKDYPQ